MTPQAATAPAEGARFEAIAAITLATHDMGRAVAFYRALGMELVFGGEAAEFSSFRVGPGHLNLVAAESSWRWSWWGRVILHVSDVDAAHRRAVAAGARVEAAPRDAEWGERFFHLQDPDGHELSLARPLAAPPGA